MTERKPSVQERYRNDAHFHNLTDTLAAAIYRGDFTPTEVREAAMLACIKIEMETVKYMAIIPKRTEEAIEELRRFMVHEEARNPQR